MLLMANGMECFSKDRPVRVLIVDSCEIWEAPGKLSAVVVSIVFVDIDGGME